MPEPDHAIHVSAGNGASVRRPADGQHPVLVPLRDQQSHASTEAALPHACSRCCNLLLGIALCSANLMCHVHACRQLLQSFGGNHPFMLGWHTSKGRSSKKGCARPRTILGLGKGATGQGCEPALHPEIWDIKLEAATSVQDLRAKLWAKLSARPKISVWPPVQR